MSAPIRYEKYKKLSCTFAYGNTACNLKTNQTLHHSDTIRGSVNREGDCKGGYLKNDKHELRNLIVQIKYKIFLSEGMAILNNEDSSLILPTGTRLKLSDYMVLTHIKKIIEISIKK